MTESARRKPIVESGLKGHNCSRLFLRRSDLFSRQCDSVQFRVGVATLGWRRQFVGCGVSVYAAFGMSS
jgi:hypothetical protein